MKWALEDGQRVEATPGLEAWCPGCGEDVVAKCGELTAWHWAHRTRDCDPWYEPDSNWHLGWKAQFPKEEQEVGVRGHRADILTKAGMVVELQAKTINEGLIKEREDHYGHKNMVWLVNALKFDIRHQAGATTTEPSIPWVVEFEWVRPRKAWFAARAPVYFDLGTSLEFACRASHVLEVREWKKPSLRPLRGQGSFMSIDRFVLDVRDEEILTRKGRIKT